MAKSMEIVLSKQTFDEKVLSSSIPVLVDFWAPWCGPCHIIAPILSQMAEEYQGKLIIGKLSVDENPVIAENYQVRSIPTLKLFKNGQIVGEVVGAVPKKDIVKLIEKHV